MNSSTAFAGTGSAGLSSPQGFDNFGDSIANAYKVFHQQEKLNNKTLDQMDSNINNNNANSALAEQQAKTEESKRNLMADESMLKQSQYMLNQVEMMLRNKDLEWYDRRAMVETKSMLMNAISNQIGAQAQMSNAATAEKMFRVQDETKRLAPLTHYVGKWTEDKFKSFKDSRFGRDLSTFARRYLYSP